jgi:hypothetical protein
VSKAARCDGSSEDVLYRELILSSMRRIVVAVLSIVITAATLIGVSFQVLSTQEVGLDYDLFSQTIGNQLFNPGTYFLGALQCKVNAKVSQISRPAFIPCR